MDGTNSAQAAPLVRYRNRSIGAAELNFIREAITRLGPDATRRRLSEEICAAWNWRQANGGLSLYACRDLLLRLEEWGHLQLPPLCRSRPTRRELPLLPKDYIALPWAEVRPEYGADLRTLAVRPIHPEERLGFRLFMDRYHYLGDKPLVGEHLLYAAFLGSDLVALLAWASATLRAPLREQFVGWDESAKRQRLHLVVNNVRFLRLPWVHVNHLASKVLGRVLRRLSADWQQRFNHPVLLAETFVEPTRFRGTCYRAANWRCLGMTAGRTRRGNAYLHEGSPKALYVYELHRDARRRLREGMP